MKYAPRNSKIVCKGFEIRPLNARLKFDPMQLARIGNPDETPHGAQSYSKRKPFRMELDYFYGPCYLSL